VNELFRNGLSLEESFKFHLEKKGRKESRRLAKFAAAPVQQGRASVPNLSEIGEGGGDEIKPKVSFYSRGTGTKSPFGK